MILMPTLPFWAHTANGHKDDATLEKTENNRNLCLQSKHRTVQNEYDSFKLWIQIELQTPHQSLVCFVSFFQLFQLNNYLGF